MLEYNE